MNTRQWVVADPGDSLAILISQQEAVGNTIVSSDADNLRVLVDVPLRVVTPAYKSADTARNEDNAPSQVETATVGGGPIVAQAQIVVTASGMGNSPKTVKFSVADGDTASQIATKARAALSADTDVSAFFTVSGATDKVILTAKTKAANDATMNMASDNDTCGGLTAGPSSANTTAGVAAVPQVETATVVGTIVTGVLQKETATIVGVIITGVLQVETATIVEDVPGTIAPGDVNVTVTAAGMANSPKVVPVTLALNDTEAQVAGKIATALGLDPDVSSFFTVTNPGGAPTTVVLTALAPAADDATMNVAYADDSSAGLTDDASSAHTTPGTASGAGNALVTVTAVGMTGTPKAIDVPVAEADDQDAIAGKIRTVLTNDADVSAFFTVSGATDKVILEAKADAANDATMNIAVTNGTCAGVTPDATSDDTTAGVASGAGTVAVTVTAAGMTNSPKTIQVTVAEADDASAIAGKIRTALTSDADVGHAATGFFTASGATDKVILTAKAAAANDATLNIATTNGTSAGLTPGASSADTTAGVLGVLQVETATIAGTAIVQCEVVVTAAGMTNSPKTILVAVAAGDTASQVAGKVRAALALDGDVTDFFTVGGGGATITLTVLVDTDYDATMNVATDNDTCAGLSTAATSANTTLLILDPHLSLMLGEGTYLIAGEIPVTTDGGGFKCDFAGGSVAAANVFLQYTILDSLGAVYATVRAGALSDPGAVVGESDDDIYTLQIRGSIEVEAAGTLGFEWGPKIDDASDSVALRGGFLEATKIA